MSRSFLIAVSGFALLSAACSPQNEAADRDDDDNSVISQERVTASSVDGRTEDTTGLLGDDARDTDIADFQGLDTPVGGDMTDDDGSILDNEAAEEDVLADSRMSQFNTDFAGTWGSEEQCNAGSNWAISESLIATPTNIVCTVSSIEEGAGQAEVTAICTGEDADGEMMEESEQTFTFAANDDGTITINNRAEEIVQRCM